MNNKDRNGSLIKNYNEKAKNIGLFVLAWGLLYIFLLPLPDMIGGSGDADSIWKTIKSFYSDDIVSSYVLYKGMFSVYPYVWLYKIAIYFNLEDFFFIRWYHCFLFAYVSSIGIPYIVNKLINLKDQVWKRVILIFCLFFLQRYTMAFSMISVDLPSLAFFIAVICSSLKFKEIKGIKRYFYIVWMGLLIGISLCFSGQYTPAVLCMILYIVIQMFSNKEKRKVIGIYLICLVIGIVPIKVSNSYFEKNVVNPMREKGEWIPTGSDWIITNITNPTPIMRYGSGVQLQDRRGAAIIAEETPGYLSSKTQIILLYAKMMLKHPIDYLVILLNKIFLVVSMDNGLFSFIHLLLSYTLLFVFLICIKRQYLNLRSIWSTKTLIYLAFLLTLAAPCVLHIEMRYGLAIQSLICAFGILSDSIWKTVDKAIKIFKEKKISKLMDQNIIKAVVYVFFICICFMHIASIYETIDLEFYQYILFH